MRASLSLAEKLSLFREELGRRGLDGFIVPRADRFQGEYVPAHEERLAWLTGFGGSAGTAVVLRDRAALFVDGRYTTQAVQEVDMAHWTILEIPSARMEDWLAENTAAGQRIGYDPWLHVPKQLEGLARACTKAGAVLTPAYGNPVDALWTDRPPLVLGDVVVHPLHYAGQRSEQKREALLAWMAQHGLDAWVIAAPDSLCWLLNIRGDDVPHTPFVLGFAVVHRDGRLDLILEPEKMTAHANQHMGPEVRVMPPDAFAGVLEDLGKVGAAVGLDPMQTPQAVHERLGRAGAAVSFKDDPLQRPKALKNTVEQDGARAAHVRDGVALCRFLHWLETQGPGLTELACVHTLRRFRAQSDLFKDESFDTIAGSGPNGAIVHYRVSEASNRTLVDGDLFLLDSGGQYLDGTTDVTRTVLVGAPDAAVIDEQRRRFTQVLKGHLALARAVFPEGTRGSQLDVLARHALWADGVDFAHGTGHGVGSYLSVHEGPQRISGRGGDAPLGAGMIVSNEPGYYKPGAYGIRIENLVLVVPAAVQGEAPRLAFETLTLAPIDRRLTDMSLLEPSEVAWLDAYHAKVQETVTPLLPEDVANWLAEACKPLR